MTIITRFMGVITLAAFVSGCATSGSDLVPPAYGTGHSDGLRQGEGLYAAEGADEESSPYQALMTNMLATASTALLLSSNAGIGLSLGKSFGLGFAATMLDPFQDQDREQDEASVSAPVAPMALQTMTPEQMQAQLRASLQQAGLQALVGMGVPQATLAQGMQVKAFYDQASNNMLVASEEDGCIKMVGKDGEGTCVLSLQLQGPTQLSSPRSPLFADAYVPPGYFGL
ncbi:hypothetical protein [Halomonas sp. M20]|uniref:hypothetical protein n=1 Tax=Halomonas sp. M20 TaxID=2763264 RepID=UPI001D09DC01|nr:hypothetical protein [Halomonas sp. M20]